MVNAIKEIGKDHVRKTIELSRHQAIDAELERQYQQSKLNNPEFKKKHGYATVEVIPQNLYDIAQDMVESYYGDLVGNLDNKKQASIIQEAMDSNTFKKLKDSL